MKKLSCGNGRPFFSSSPPPKSLVMAGFVLQAFMGCTLGF